MVDVARSHVHIICPLQCFAVLTIVFVRYAADIHKLALNGKDINLYLS